MKVIHGIELKPGSREELLPGYSAEFPYIASFVELDKYAGRQAPWHWHKDVELFLITQGEVEYYTTGGKKIFCAGMGGFVNANALHMTKTGAGSQRVTSLLHLFDPLLISGQKGSAIDQKYVLPLTTASRIEIMGLYPDNPRHVPGLEALRKSFEIQENGFAYELRMRSALSDMWIRLLEIAQQQEPGDRRSTRVSDKIKMMLYFIHEHYMEKITVQQVAASAFISERECFRVFRDCLQTTPVEYLAAYRIQKACYLLVEGTETVTAVGQACGLGSSSYFGKVFRESMGMSPTEYRKKGRSDQPERQHLG